MSKPTTSQNLESRHEAGEDVLDYFDTAKATRTNHAKARVNLDLPTWMIGRVDRLASRNGMTRQAQIKAWLADRLKSEAT